ncbi:heat-inducible protein [Superficieibacter electus]|uniref:Heat-inducible protein n=1 Tax=Superficieibacter electus TaxID=2022662 RepID=A0A2P5GUU7_9ENTR|nr:heat shock protein HslJ [Superficieibacter electus]POP44330.1 heat-inducible protein [Superficieibacter electus]POP50348.1 heat-inducible protein [Superficieibacter electus]
MKKGIALLCALLLAGCVTDKDTSVTAEKLQQQRFVLETANGEPVKASDKPLELAFGDKTTALEHVQVSGSMCNRFTGSGKMSAGELKVKDMAMTRMMCSDPQLNTLDHTISAMLSAGAQVDLTGDQLTLATANQTLTFKRVNQAS